MTRTISGQLRDSCQLSVWLQEVDTSRDGTVTRETGGR